MNPLPTSIKTPVNIKHFKQLLTHHPDPNMVSYLITGLTRGFDIGFSGSLSLHNYKTHKNLLSAIQYPPQITEAISIELQRGHISGPFKDPPWKNIHCSPLGSRIKPDGSHRLILDLSQPIGESVNDGIQKEEFSVKYSGFDTATDLVFNNGVNCLMSKMDIKQAFRILPVKPSQWPLLGTFWQGNYYIETRLPFGLRSSPGIFNRFADCVCWIITEKYKIKNITHYSDDFFLVGPPNYHQAKEEVNTAVEAFKYLGIPLAPEKQMGPNTSMTYLGININSENMSMSIPEEKYYETLTLLKSWGARKKCRKRELLSLIGKLSFLCKVVRPGRIFLRRLIELSCTVKHNHHHININKTAQADIQWWSEFLPLWNRTSIIPESFTISNADLQLFTDASGMGMGAIFGNSWIQAQWPPEIKPQIEESINIDCLELFAIFAACSTWGTQWAGKRIIFITDNAPITDIWQAGTTKSQGIMTLVREMYFLAAKLSFSISLKHIKGVDNKIADSISRFQMEKFQQLIPTANIVPTKIPATIWATLRQATCKR